MNVTKLLVALLASIVLLAAIDKAHTHAQGLVEYAIILAVVDGAGDNRQVAIGEDGFTAYGDGSATGTLTIEEPGRHATYRIREARVQCDASVPAAQFEGVLAGGNSEQSPTTVTIFIEPVGDLLEDTTLQLTLTEDKGETYTLTGEGTLLVNPCEQVSNAAEFGFQKVVGVKKP